LAISLALAISACWVSLSPPHSRIIISFPVSRAVIDTHFGNFAQETAVSGVSFPQAFNPDVYADPGLRVPQFFKPFVEFAGSAYRHILRVDYNLQIVKGFFREISVFLSGYLPGFFPASGFFGGLPIGASRMRSRVSGGYIASRVIGLIPAWKTRCLTVLGGMPNFRAISRIVQPLASIFDFRKIFKKKVDFLLDIRLTIS
jgi:hypothetical protein